MVIPPGERQGEFLVLLCPDDQLQCRADWQGRRAFHADAGSSYVLRREETVNGTIASRSWVENEQTARSRGPDSDPLTLALAAALECEFGSSL